LDVDARVGIGVGAGGADVATDVAMDGLGEAALGDGMADGGVTVGELVDIDVAPPPQPPIVSATATMTKARRGFMVQAFRQERATPTR
jgi:hypothetical protein